MSHPTQEELVLVHYHEGDPDIAAHVMACAECRDELETIRRVLRAVDAAEVPEPDDAWESTAWSRLRWRLDAPRSRSRAVPRWSLGAIAAALLVIAFLGGRLWQRGTGQATPGTTIATTSEAGRDRIFFVVVGDHLDRSQRVLMEVANQDPQPGGDLRGEQKLAEDLVQSNRIYRQTAIRSGDTRLASVLDELEPILLEIAHTPSDPSPRALESLRRRIESKGLIFKLRVVGDDVKRKETTKGLAGNGGIDL
jgi:hypothetical protein